MTDFCRVGRSRKKNGEEMGNAFWWHYFIGVGQ